MNEEPILCELPFLESTTTSLKLLSNKRILQTDAQSDELLPLSQDFSTSLQKKRKVLPSEQFQLSENSKSSPPVALPDYRTFLEQIQAEEHARIPVAEPEPKFSDSTTEVTTGTLTSERKTFALPCQHAGCGEMSNYKIRCLCHKHYKQELRQERASNDKNIYKTTRTSYTDVETEELATYYEAKSVNLPLLTIIHGTCRMKGCHNSVRSRGLCNKHYVAAQRAAKKMQHGKK